MYREYLKSPLDRLTALIALIVFSPIFLLIVLVIRSERTGPVFFKQERAGRLGETFKVFKFRSMSVDTPDVPSSNLALKKITPVGLFLRRTNLDELPQLFNVLIGEMSLIGPRPCLVSETKLLELRKKNGSIELRPGITGWAQVNAYTGMEVEEKAEFDGEYNQNLGLVLDMSILMKTFKYLTKPPPVY